MSLLLTGLVVASASGVMLVGRWLANRRRPDAGAPDDAKAAKEAERAGGDAAPEAAAARGEADRIEGFPCQLGDVVMRVTGEEAWLAGGLVLSEDAPVAILFVAPDAGHDCAIYVTPRPREALLWLSPLDPTAVLVGGEPPTSVEHGGVRFERERRLPLRPRRLGVGAPDVGDSVIVAEYASTGAERLVVLKTPVGSRAYRGLALDASAYEVIASGRATID